MPATITEIGRLHYEITGDSKSLTKAVKQARTETETELDRLTRKFVQAVDAQNKAQAAGNNRAALIAKGRQKTLAKAIADEEKQMQDHAKVMARLQPDTFLGKFQQKLQSGFGEGNAGVLAGMLGFTAIGAVAVAAGTKFVEIYGAIVRKGITEAIEAGVVAANIQRAEIALSAITGSASEARTAVADMIELSRTQPGLTFEAAIEGNQRLRAVRFSADEAKKAVEGLAKVRLLSGGTKQDLEAVLLNFQQIRSYGKLTGDELRETLMRMPYMSEVFLRAFGTINTEKIKELNLSSDELFDRIFEAMEHLPEVTVGASTAWEKFENQLGLSQLAFGQETLEGFIDLMFELTDALRSNESSFRSWGEDVGNILSGLAASIEGLDAAAKVFGARGDFHLTDILVPGSGMVREIGRRRQEEAYRKKQADAFERAKNNRTGEGLSFDVNTMTVVDNTAVNRQRELARTEREGQFKEDVRNQEIALRSQLESLQNFYAQKAALQLNFNRYSSESEIQYLTRRAEITREQSQAELAVLQNAFNQRKRLIDERVASVPERDRARTWYEESKKLVDIDKQIGDVRTRLVVDSLNSQLEIEKAHTENLNKIYARRRDDRLQAIETSARLAEARIRVFAPRSLEEEQSINTQIADLRLRSAQQQYDAQVAYFDEQLALYKDDAGKVVELEQEKYRALTEIQTQFQLSSIANERETLRIQEAMRVRDRQSAENSYRQLASTYQEIAQQFSIENLASIPSSQYTKGGFLGIQPQLRRQYADMFKTYQDEAATKGFGDPGVQAMSQRLEEISSQLGSTITRTSGAMTEVVALIEKFKGNLGDDTILDQIQMKMLDVERQAGEVPLLAKIAEIREQGKAGILKGGEFTSQLSAAELALTQFQSRMNDQAVAVYSNSIAGLTEKLKALRDATSADSRAQKILANKELEREQIGVRQQITLAEQRLAESSEAVADRIKLAHLQTAYEIQSRYEQAMIAIDKAQQEMADKTIYHHEQVMAKIQEAIATAPGLTDILGDAQAGAILDFYKLLDDSVAGFVKQLGLADTAFGNFIQTMLAGLAKLAAAKLFEILFGAQTTNGGGQSSGGGWLGKLLGAVIGALGSAFGGSFGGGGGGLGAGDAGGIGAGTIYGPGGIGGGGGTILGLAGDGGGIATKGVVVEPGKEGTMTDSTSVATLSPTFVFQANPQTGRFSQESAEQSVRKLMMLQARIAQR